MAKAEVTPLPTKAVTSEKAKREMEATIITGKANILARILPDLREEILAIGEDLANFQETDRRVKAVERLVELKGEGAEKAREGFATVLWCDRDNEVIKAITPLIKGLEDKNVRDDLLGRMGLEVA